MKAKIGTAASLMTAAAIFLAAAASTNAQPDRATASPAQRSGNPAERADKFLGREIRTQDDRRIGKINDLVVELASGRVLYVVVSTAGTVSVAVPPGLFTE